MERTIALGAFSFVATPREDDLAVSIIFDGRELNATEFNPKREVPIAEMLADQSRQEDLFLAMHTLRETAFMVGIGAIALDEPVRDAFFEAAEKAVEQAVVEAESFQATKH
ncbi:hypothetical protein [Vibrio cholerae]|uniref:hypothetical protein n=1 Tax=Vibrio phage ICP2_2013_A_Haiti TaxID=1529058 RepID=UPI0004E5D023|nr:hypothetical protein [Vibrio cholerae]YP_009056246.1 hypothetical protein LD36_gp34 [Vibrio phage ICP2_2013_A_Haiti]AII27148.1 hypothetical protein ICP22013AHaiti_34 [Vibrio phage ICP2_2013_A_Haiti]